MSSFLLHKARVSEDALTGALADILSWWPAEAMSLLSRARRFDGTKVGEPSGVGGGHGGELVVTPWPRWRSGEPDLVLEFSREGTRSLVIIEAKLGAEKSSTDGEALPLTEDAIADQLAKYFIDAIHGRDRRGAHVPHRVDVVYLTHHLFAPVEDLAASHRAMPRAVAGRGRRRALLALVARRGAGGRARSGGRRWRSTSRTVQPPGGAHGGRVRSLPRALVARRSTRSVAGTTPGLLEQRLHLARAWSRGSRVFFNRGR